MSQTDSTVRFRPNATSSQISAQPAQRPVRECPAPAMAETRSPSRHAPAPLVASQALPVAVQPRPVAPAGGWPARADVCGALLQAMLATGFAVGGLLLGVSALHDMSAGEDGDGIALKALGTVSAFGMAYAYLSPDPRA